MASRCMTSQIPDSMKEAEFVRVMMIDEVTEEHIESTVVSLKEAEHLMRLEIVWSESLCRVDEADVPLHLWALGDAHAYQALLDEREGYSR